MPPVIQDHVLPGTGFIIERRESDGTLTVMPLVGWQVVDGEVYPLPRSLGAEWLVRAVTEGDERHLRTTASRMRPTNTRRRRVELLKQT